jgi:hypothetical protein
MLYSKCAPNTKVLIEMVDVSAIRTIVPSLDVVCCKVMLNSLTHIYVFVLYFPPFLTISDFLTALECLELMISSLSSKVLGTCW